MTRRLPRRRGYAGMPRLSNEEAGSGGADEIGGLGILEGEVQALISNLRVPIVTVPMHSLPL